MLEEANAGCGTDQDLSSACNLVHWETTPQGQEVDAQFVKWLMTRQKAASLFTTVAGLLDAYSDNPAAKRTAQEIAARVKRWQMGGSNAWRQYAYVAGEGCGNQHLRCGIFVARAVGFSRATVRSSIVAEVAPTELVIFCGQRFHKDVAPLELGNGGAAARYSAAVWN